MWSTRKLIAYGLTLLVGAAMVTIAFVVPGAEELQMPAGIVLGLATGGALLPTAKDSK